MNTLKNSEAGSVVLDLIRTIQENKDFLSEVDGKIGDGDHGINMNKGFTMTGEKLKGKTFSLSEGLSILGATLLEDIGGSMGPLYGVLFDEMAMASEEKEIITAEVFQEMAANAVAGVQEIGNAQVGDKPLLDTLIPASTAYEQALAEGKDFCSALDDFKSAAKTGWQSTENMIAKVGRASRLGERSRGVLDAGATSCYLLMNSLAESIQKLLQ